MGLESQKLYALKKQSFTRPLETKTDQSNQFFLIPDLTLIS